MSTASCANNWLLILESVHKGRFASEPIMKDREAVCQECFPTCGIQRGVLYLATEVCWRCRINEKTLNIWIAAGLRVAKPKTKQRFFLGDDLIRFIFGET